MWEATGVAKWRVCRGGSERKCGEKGSTGGSKG